MTRSFLFLTIGLIVLVSACSDRTPEAAGLQITEPALADPGAVSQELKASTPLAITQTLSADNMAGRQTATAGNEKARVYLRKELRARGLDVHEQAFTFLGREGGRLEGINLLARIAGKADGPVMIVTAHYDHVGVRGGEIFNGADDNASGVAGAFAVADHFLSNPPEHDVVIALLDAEEMGLQGARALVRKGLPQGGEIAFNLNFDMLSRNENNELYAAGAWHRPFLEPMLNAIGADAPVSLKLGHDDPALGQGDWTLQSDHGPFHQAGVPFVYFGVEDHKDYHQPSDDFETIPQDFFLRSIETVVIAAERFDAELDGIVANK